VRELAEELGLSIEAAGELVNPAGPPWPISDTLTLRCWFARIVAGHPAAGDSHDEVRWLGAADLDDVAWLDADRPIADLLLRRLRPARS